MADFLQNYSIESDAAGNFLRMAVTRRIDTTGVWQGETTFAFDERELTAFDPGGPPLPEDLPPGIIAAIDAVTAQVFAHMEGLRTPEP